jgi:hypothetical protein
MLVNHDPSGYLALLAPDAGKREQPRLITAQPADGDGTVTLLAAGHSLLPAPIKVNGSMSVSTDKDGNLLVHTNYVFAYPFRPTDPSTITESWQIVAVVHVAVDYAVIESSQYTPGSQGAWVGGSQSYDSSMACGPFKQGYLAPAYLDQAPHGPQTDNPDAYYDPNHSLDIPNTCGG